MRRVVGDYVVDLFIEEEPNEGFRIINQTLLRQTMRTS